jgi:hypothetical protein
MKENNTLAVQENPYPYWSDERSESDYRSRETQASSLTRQMLRQPEYLLRNNRVNPGPLRNLRARTADSIAQIPHDTRNEEMWGWQRWTDRDYYLVESDISNNLLEETDSGTRQGDGGIIYPDYSKPEYEPSTIISTSNLKSFDFTQISPSSEWVIVHNLGFYPSVELFSISRAEIDGDVVHLSTSRLKVLFNIPISGYARLN